MADRVELFTSPISHYCVSAERMLAFKGIPWKSIYTPYHGRRELLRRTHQDYIPALLWNGRFVRWDAIPSFLEKRRPTPTLLPAGRAALAQALENWGHQVLEERAWRAVVTRAPRLLRTEHERWVFEEMQTRARGPWHVLERRRSEFARELRPYLTLVNAMLADRDWILDEPSLADFGIYGSLSPWWTVGERIPTRLAALNGWAQRIASLGG
jgi:glutathione S-transferase